MFCSTSSLPQVSLYSSLHSFPQHAEGHRFLFWGHLCWSVAAELTLGQLFRTLALGRCTPCSPFRANSWRIQARQKWCKWKRWKESLQVFWQRNGGTVSPPRCLLTPLIVRLINNLGKYSIIVGAFRQPGCDAGVAFASHLFKNEYAKERGRH